MNNITINSINTIKNNLIAKGYQWVESWLFSTNAKQIGMCAMRACLVIYCRLDTILCIVNSFIEYISRVLVICKPNKIHIMKAQNKCKVNSKNSREKGFIREDFYAYVKKLVYVLVTTTEVVIYEFLDIIWIIAIIKDSCYYGYSQDPSPPKEESLSIEDNNAQEAKEIKPEQSESNLNVKEELSNEPWDVTASGDNNVIAKRARMNRSTDLEKKGRKGSSNEESDNKTKTVRNKKAHTFVLERLGKYYDKSTNTYNGIIKVLRNTEFLQLCYLEIKSKLGNMTKGLDRTTLDSISMKTFENLSKSIMNGSFDFKLARRHMILKKDGSLRLLGISSLIEKIVHKGLQVILECIFELLFEEESYGFRPNKSVHSALKLLYLKGHHHTWVIQGDITKCFDSIPHDVIMDSLRNHIKCDKFLIVINKLLKAGYKNLVTEKIMKSNMGTLQGSVVSPMLANIVLDRFDKIVKYSIMLEYTKGKRRKSNPEYDKLISIRYSRTKGLLHTLEARQALLDMRKIPRYQTNDLNFRRSMYIRYADDFVFLLAGLYKEALEIKSKLADILKVECGLELNEKKTLVTHLSKGFEFLGANIKKLKYDNEPIFVSHTKNGKLVKQRRAVRLRLNVLFKKLINRLIDNKFIRRNHLNKIYATLKDSVILLSHDRIVEFFNQKWRGILNFYSFAANKHMLGNVHWLLRYSLAKTLAKKYKLSSARAAFKKFGPWLKCLDTDIMFILTVLLLTNHDYKVGKELDWKLDILDTNWFGTTTQSSIFKKCCICGSTNNLEMHHLRKVNDVRSSYKSLDLSYKKWVGSLQRKQILLCKYHHMMLHRGQLLHYEVRIINSYRENLGLFLETLPSTKDK